MKGSLSNLLAKNQKLYVLSLKITEIWNLVDVFDNIGYSEDLEISVKIG